LFILLSNEIDALLEVVYVLQFRIAPFWTVFQPAWNTRIQADLRKSIRFAAESILD
jgi:hypothetical protein